MGHKPITQMDEDDLQYWASYFLDHYVRHGDKESLILANQYDLELRGRNTPHV